MGDMSTNQHERIPALTLGWRLKMSLGDVGAQEIADDLGVSRGTVSRWMSDKGAPPKRAYIAQWAMKTGVPMLWLEKGVVPDEGPSGPDDGEAGEGRPTLPYGDPILFRPRSMAA